MTQIIPYPASKNTEWGFFGTMAQQTPSGSNQAWQIAMRTIEAETDADPDQIRDFLDSRYGRHFADDVCSAGGALEDAIVGTVARWMAWRISRSTSRDTGIPVGIPYLWGFIVHAAIGAEA